MSQNVIGCGWCFRRVILADAHHAEGLVGNFCSEGCVIACFKAYSYIVPFPEERQAQMGTEEAVPEQQGNNEAKQTQQDDLSYRRREGDWQ